jgi:hypothetical protein
MFRTLSFLALLAMPMMAVAQEQQAGAMTDTDAAFQALIDACDDVEVLMLRSRIRLQLPHTTDEAAASAQEMLNEAFATCGEGDVEAAKAQLTEALALAEAGATEVYATTGEAPGGTTGDEAAETELEAAAKTGDASADEAPARPWWKLW